MAEHRQLPANSLELPYGQPLHVTNSIILLVAHLPMQVSPVWLLQHNT